MEAGFSGVHFCRSTAPRALALASVCTSCYVLWEFLNISSMGAIITHYLSCENALSFDSSHLKLMLFHVRACKGSAILLNPLINLRKNCMKCKNYCTCCMVVGVGHSLRLLTLASLIYSPSGVMSNPRKVVVHHRKLHFFSLQ